VTLFDTYGEVEALLDRVRDLASDETNGAIIVFSFSHDVAFANSLVRAGAHGFISKGVPAPEIVDGIRAAARGERALSSNDQNTPRWPPSSAGLAAKCV
jgi:DNA-binding NarL/FixJ family response regulator